ncbi:hypothetical protein ACD578_28925 (plasmid) [Microvirga sp. RSM25]|uniref:maleate cis-trans isomerase family protein n=1 Tax=Microvirga sp. RSM25 TaxID=3273802 RepID=UPI00384CD177
MPDLLGYRLKLGVAVPSTNTSVQPEMDALRPAGVTNHLARIIIDDESLEEEAGFNSVIDRIRRSTGDALKSLSNCGLQRVIVAVSPDSYWEGAEHHRSLVAQFREAAGGAEITTSADAIEAALEKLGGLRRIGLISPYAEIGDDPASRFFVERGYEVVALHGLGGKSPSRIADVTTAKLRAAVEAVNRPEVEVIVQVGTNVPMAAFAALAENRVGKPVIANNAVLYWHALRHSGIADSVERAGSLFSTH